MLDCLDAEQTPCGKGTLVRFRAALIAKGGDRRLIEKTIEIAKKTQGYSESSLKAALDSSPLWGAARVEDTYNLLGHALRKSLEIIAKNTQQDLGASAAQAGASIVAASSLKRALDLDWDDPTAREQALNTILQALNQAENWVESQSNLTRSTAIDAQKSLADAREIEVQDIEKRADGSPKLCQGVARNRRIAIEDPDMKHGRKSRSKRFDRYKRHILKDLDSGMVRAVGVTLANEAEASVTDALAIDLSCCGI